MPKSPSVSATTRGLSHAVYSDLLSRAQASGRRVLSLHVGDTYLDPPPAARSEAILSAEHPRLHNYAPVQGEPVLLDAIEAHVRKVSGVELRRELLQVTSGATTGLSVVAQSILDPGDEVLVPSPYWPLIRGIVSSRGAVPVEVPLLAERRLSPEEIEARLEGAITPRTAALYVNAIHNPTGMVLSKEDLDAFDRVATRHDLWLLCDEAYEELAFVEAPPPLYARAHLGDRTITAHTLSKGRGLAGARVGFVHGPASVMATIRAVNTYQSYGPARPMQLAAARALADKAWVASARALYRSAAEVASSALDVPMPEGGTFLFFDARNFSGAVDPSRDILERLADVGVVMTGGAACGRDYGAFVRMCFTTLSPGDLDEAMARTKDVIRP